MLKRIFVICGIIFFLAGVGLSLYPYYLKNDAITRDKQIEKGSVLVDGAHGGGSKSIDCPTSWSLNISQRVISEDTTLPLIFVVTNENTSRGCTVTIDLNAPGFDPNPSNSVKLIYLPPHMTIRRTLWFLTPKRTGQLYVDVNLEGPSPQVASADINKDEPAVNYILDEKTIGIAVNTIFGMSPAIANWVSLFWTVLGPTILGITLAPKLWNKLGKGMKGLLFKKADGATPSNGAKEPSQSTLSAEKQSADGATPSNGAKEPPQSTVSAEKHMPS